MQDDQVEKVKAEIAIKMMLWGLFGVVLHVFNTINVNEYLFSKYKPIFICLIIVIIIISITTIYSINNENKHLNPYGYHLALIYDQLIDFTISSYGLVWIILFMMSIAHKQILVSILSFGVAYAWWKIFTYAKIVFMITQMPNQSILSFLNKSKISLFKSEIGATSLIISLTIIGIVFMSVGL